MIYTRRGDQGETSLGDGRRVKKNDCLVATLGAADELNAVIGLALAQLTANNRQPVAVRSQFSLVDQKLLVRAQNNCLVIGALLSSSPTSNSPISSRSKKRPAFSFSPQETVDLEERIDRLTAKLPPLKNFILPGGSVGAATLHVARTICRRLERELIDVAIGDRPTTTAVRAYLNRLSDYLFTLARWQNRQAKMPDQIWPNKP